MHHKTQAARPVRQAPSGDSASLAATAKWFVVATKPARELFARTQLDNQGFETFLPMQQRTVRSGKRLVDRRTAYFPGYLFLRLDPDDIAWRAVNSTRGVRRLIMAGERPLPLPRGFVEGLQSLADPGGLIRPEHGLKTGDRVRIIAGPFADLIGTLHEMEGKGRLSVLVELLNGAVPLSLDRASLMPVD